MNQIEKPSIFPCLFAGLGFLYIFLQLDLIAPLNHSITTSYHLSFVAMGFFSASYLIAIAVFYIPAGIVTDHYNPHKLLLIGLAISVLMTFTLAHSKQLSVLIFSRLAGGIVHPLIFLSCMRIISNHYKQRTAFYIGLAITIGLTGGIISQYPFVKLITLIGWHHATNVIALSGLLMWAIIFMYFMPYKKWHSDHSIQSRRMNLNYLLGAAKNPQNLLLGIYACLMNLPVITIGTSWGNRFITTHYMLSNLSASKIIPWVYIGFMLGSPLSGWLSDYFRTRKKIMLGSAIILFLLTFCWGHEALGFNTLIILTVLIGIFSGSQVLSYTCLSESNPAHMQSIATGYASVIIMGGNAALIPLIGWLLSHYSNQSYTALLIIPILLFLNIFLTAFFCKESLQYKQHGEKI